MPPEQRELQDRRGLPEQRVQLAQRVLPGRQELRVQPDKLVRQGLREPLVLRVQLAQQGPLDQRVQQEPLV